MREAPQSYVDDLDSSDIPAADLAKLRPYRAATILQFDPDDFQAALQSIRRFLRGLPSGREKQYVVVGAKWDDTDGSSFNELLDFDDLDVVVHQHTSPAPWSSKDSSYLDVSHLLNVALFRRGLVAVHLAEPWKTAMQRWLDKPPKPPLWRVPTAVLEHSFLRGEAKGLWLRGTHSRRRSRPDAKNYTGLSLANALDPIEDSSFAMGSGRAEFSSISNPALKGTIGTTPRKSTVWSGRASDFSEYVTFCRGLLNEVEQTFTEGRFTDSVFPELAEEISSLDGVYGAYEVLFEWPDGPPGDTADNDTLEIVNLLDRTAIDILGSSTSAHFSASITFPEESTPAPAEVRVRPVDSGFDLDCTINRPGRHHSTGVLRDSFKNTDIVSVYYESGHTITNGRLYRFEVKPARFQNWIFNSFVGYDTTKEKPSGSGTKMYDAIGEDGDNSLFGWVVSRFPDGYLTCDDGSGETADFVYISAELDFLKLIHVKAAQSSSTQRGVSAQAYEVVASQAAKNLVFLNPTALMERLARSSALNKPSWTKGARVTGRAEFVDALANLKGTAETATYIVQPHMQEQVYGRHQGSSTPGPEGMRLRLLETLLNNVRSSAVSYSSDLFVVGESS